MVGVRGSVVGPGRADRTAGTVAEPTPPAAPPIAEPTGPHAPYAELHCHSNFSFLDGTSSPESLVAEAVGLGLDALALTDHDGLYGAPGVRRARCRLRPAVGVSGVSADDGDPEDGLDRDDWDDAAPGCLHGLPDPVGGPDPILAGCDIVEMFAGPGGWSTGLGIVAPLLDRQPVVAGVDFSADACATATAAGHTRLCRSVTEIDPRHYPRVRGAILSAPCATWSATGRQSAHHADDGQVALDSITCLGSGCGCDYAGLGDRVGDRRTALIVEILRWAVLAPGLGWIVAGQVPSAEPAFVDIVAELYSLGWEYMNVVVLDTARFGAATRRRRVFLFAHKTCPVSVWYGNPAASRSMAAALGWPAGEKVRTRGARRATGGNLFSADGPS